MSLPQSDTDNHAVFSDSGTVVRVVPLQPHCFAFGGFELQMINAMNAARSAGVNIAPLEIWQRQAEFDVLHLWGLDLQHVNTIHWAHHCEKKIVLSVLVKYPDWRNRFRFMMSRLFGAWRMKSRMLSMVDAITVVNLQQSNYLSSIVGYPRERIFVVPNVVEDIFFSPPENIDDFTIGFDNYVLSTGNICRRKNQLALVRACRLLKVPLILVGTVLPGEEEYAAVVGNEVSSGPDMQWIKGLPSGSAELAMLYHRAAVFALVSYEETQPISALEAVATGKPLLLSDRPYAQQEFYQGAALVAPESVTDISLGIKRVLDNPAPYTPPRNIVEQCRFFTTGKTYAQVYQTITKTT